MLPCAAYLRGEYGVKGLYVGAPCIIGAKGVEKVIEIKLDRAEKAMFNKSVRAVKTLIGLTKKIRQQSAAAAQAKKAPAKKAPAKKAPKSKRKSGRRK